MHVENQILKETLNQTWQIIIILSTFVPQSVYLIIKIFTNRDPDWRKKIQIVERKKK